MVFTIGTSIASVATAWIGELPFNWCLHSLHTHTHIFSLASSRVYFALYLIKINMGSLPLYNPLMLLIVIVPKQSWLEFWSTFLVIFITIASLICGAGYSIRHLHQLKVDQRLESIENTVSIGCSKLLSFFSLLLFELLCLGVLYLGWLKCFSCILHLKFANAWCFMSRLTNKIP